MTTLLPHLRELQPILEKGLWMNNTGFGSVQLFNRREKTLEIVAQKGFSTAFLEHFRVVRSSDHSACGRAFGEGSTVFVNDVTCETGFEPHRQIARNEGFRSVVSHPLIADGRQMLGVLSMHFRKPRFDWDNLCISPTINEMVRLIQRVRLAHTA